jgi:hypothetical protein
MRCKRILRQEQNSPQIGDLPTKQNAFASFGHIDEWHVEIDKSWCKNGMGEKGLACLDGVEQRPIFGNVEGSLCPEVGRR